MLPRPRKPVSYSAAPNTSGEDAVKKFGNAKSISSDMFFGNENQVSALAFTGGGGGGEEVVGLPASTQKGCGKGIDRWTLPYLSRGLGKIR